ncbi:MAG: phosphodiester glycosidase family protein [Streptosporangiales bacterium]|nr:phosphodiester glycosidase family protein [Streptosporangiales bacterium]MBO0892189.1 phosphodiester glycosidase family protein [Acidothermales bacterium]
MLAVAVPRARVLATTVLAAVVAVLLVLVPSGGAYAAAPAIAFTDTEPVAPGVVFHTFSLPTSHGTVQGYDLDVDLSQPGGARLGLLRPDANRVRTTPSAMADALGAVAGVNGDFFNIEESQHPGVEPTGMTDGPEVSDGFGGKAAVPDSQRFGPALPPGTSTRDVFGVGRDGRARLGTLDLDGKVDLPDRTIALDGLNQYALPENGVGAFTSWWGAASRLRATCGSDTRRAAPCSTRTLEVVVQDGRVTDMHPTPGAGLIDPDGFVLVARDAGVDELAGLRVGDPVHVNAHLVPEGTSPFTFAVGGFPILRGGAPLAGLDPVTLAPRTSAGATADGQHVHLVAVDGGAASGNGLSVAELADVQRDLGCAVATNEDGGGSTSIVARPAGGDHVLLRNRPSGGAERPVANGIGVFTSR